MERKKLERGEVVFREGDKATCMYEVLSGKIGIYKYYGTERQKKLNEVTGERFFGELGLLAMRVRTATAVAEESNTTVEVIDPNAFSELLYESPDKLLLIIRQMSKRVSQLTTDYLEAYSALMGVLEAEEAGTQRDEELNEKIENVRRRYEGSWR